MDIDNEPQGSMAALVGLEIVGEQTVVAELLFGEESHKVYVRVSETFAEDKVTDVVLRIGNGWAYFSAASLRTPGSGMELFLAIGLVVNALDVAMITGGLGTGAAPATTH